MGRGERGQATAEFALVVPLLVTMALLVLQVALVGRDAVLLSHATSVAARAAAIDPNHQRVAEAVVAASPLAADRLVVTVEPQGDQAAVTLTYSSPTDVPVVGALVADVALSERLVVQLEP